VAKAGLTGALKTFGATVAAHEAAHVQALKKTLGSKAVKKRSFDFKGTTSKASTFAQTAKVLEDTGVEAYQGQATNIKSPAVLKAAISIHPVEARHAAWIASILGQGSGSPSPAPDAFNPAKDMAAILAAVKQTGFIASLRPPDPRGFYGPYALGLSAYSPVYTSFAGGDGQVGIHGTDNPGAIGRDVSHGCIRVANAAVARLARRLPLGTPVVIVR
jgi:hypothetical protein